MNGIIIVNKKEGYTSFDYVAKIKKILHTKKVGHTGTLDPLATGVLVICVNEATKLVPFLESDSKTYECNILLGTSTDTFDITGNVVEEISVKNIDNNKIDEVLESFRGESMQKPPIYSALKKDGKKLYEYAREGKNVDICERRINIYEIKRTSDIAYIDSKALFSFSATVSKGTYIRSLCVDIAKRLGTIGTMKALKRTKSGIFRLDEAYDLENIENGNYNLISMIDAMKKYPIICDEDSLYKASHGMKISKSIINLNVCYDKKFIVASNDKLIAVYQYNLEYDCYTAVRVWN